jgi:hypothetical protein
MPVAEPLPPVLIITTIGALLAMSVSFSRGSRRFGVPVGTD